MSKMWNECLWDTFNPHVYNFNKYNFDFLKNLIDFMKQRSKIEENYCKDIKKLCNEFHPKEYNKKKNVRFSVQASFDVALGDLALLAEQREQLGRQLHENARQLRNELTEMRKSVGAIERQIVELFRDLESGRKRLSAARGIYHRAHADMVKAAAAPEAAAAESAVDQRRQLCGARREAYSMELAGFNDLQRSLYHSDLPEQLNRLEMLERNFCTVSRIRMVEWTKLEAAALDIQGRSAEAMSVAANGVDPDSDVATFVQVTVSGRPLPADLTLEEPPSGPNSISVRLPKQPPIEANRDEIRQEADKLDHKIDGLRKLRDAYKANPQMGDPAAVEAELLAAMGTSGRLRESLLVVDGFGDEYACINDEPQNKAAVAVSAVAAAPAEAPAQTLAVVLYDFADSGQPCTLAVTGGERVRVLRPDPEWSLVARLDGAESGFVPTAYISDAPPE